MLNVEFIRLAAEGGTERTEGFLGLKRFTHERWF